jgi:hypothetical protein
MRRASAILLIMFFVLLPTTAAPVQGVLPNLEIENWYFSSDPQFTFFVEHADMCDVTYGGLGIFHYVEQSGPITINFYPGSAGDCSGPTVAAFTIPYTVGEFYTIMVYADTSGNPAFTMFNNDVSAIPARKARLFVRNAYSVPSVDFVFQRQGHGPATTLTVANGQQQVIDLTPGKWDVTLNGVTIPVEFFTWDVPYLPGDFWSLAAAGPVNEGVVGIWDFRYGG